MHRNDLPRAGGPGPTTRVLACGLAVALGLGAAPARAANDSFDADADAEDTGEIVEEPGFFGTYFPWAPDDALPAPVDDAVVMIYLLNLLPLGGIWGPLVAIDKDGRPEMGGDMVVPWLVPMLTSGLVQGCGVAAIGLGGCVGLVVTGLSSGPGILCVPCLMSPGCLVVAIGIPLQLWTAPTAVINAWGRAYASRDGAVPDQLKPGPQPEPDAPASPEPPTSPAPARPPAGEWGPAEQPAAPPQPAPPAPGASKKKPGTPKPADDEGEWVPY